MYLAQLQNVVIVEIVVTVMSEGCHLQIQSQAGKLGLGLKFLGPKDHIHSDLHAYQVGLQLACLAQPCLHYCSSLPSF